MLEMERGGVLVGVSPQSLEPHHSYVRTLLEYSRIHTPQGGLSGFW